MTSKRRKVAALLLAAALTTLGACDSEDGSVSEDPQGPADGAPGTEGPDVSPDK